MQPSALPGSIKLTRAAVYARWPYMTTKIHNHFDAWRDTVPVGWTGTVDQILNYQRTTGDPGHGMPLEIVRDLLCDGSGWNSIDGITVDTSTLPWIVKKVAYCPECYGHGTVDIHDNSHDGVIGSRACGLLDDPDCHPPATPVPLAAFIVPGHHPDCDRTCKHAYPYGCPPF